MSTKSSSTKAKFFITCDRVEKDSVKTYLVSQVKSHGKGNTVRKSPVLINTPIMDINDPHSLSIIWQEHGDAILRYTYRVAAYTCVADIVASLAHTYKEGDFPIVNVRVRNLDDYDLQSAVQQNKPWKQIADTYLDDMSQQFLKNSGITVSLNKPELINYVTDPDKGDARQIKNIIDNDIRDVISDYVLAHPRDNHLRVDVAGESKAYITVTTMDPSDTTSEKEDTAVDTTFTGCPSCGGQTITIVKWEKRTYVTELDLVKKKTTLHLDIDNKDSVVPDVIEKVTCHACQYDLTGFDFSDYKFTENGV